MLPLVCQELATSPALQCQSLPPHTHTPAVYFATLLCTNPCTPPHPPLVRALAPSPAAFPTTPHSNLPLSLPPSLSHAHTVPPTPLRSIFRFLYRQVRRNADSATDEERARLQVVGEFHTGTFINQMRNGSLVMRLPDSEHAGLPPPLLFAGTDGRLGVVARLPPALYEWATKLQVCGGWRCRRGFGRREEAVAYLSRRLGREGVVHSRTKASQPREGGLRKAMLLIGARVVVSAVECSRPKPCSTPSQAQP